MPFYESSKSLVEIDLCALGYNLAKLLQITKPRGCSIMPIVKSDAYGHGIVEISKFLEKKDIWGLGIYEIEEAAILRRQGITCPIFLLSGLLGGDAKRAIELDLTIGIVSKRELDEVNEAAKSLSIKSKVHLKVDTGMSRFGLLPNQLLEVIISRHKWPNLIFEGLYSHFSSADMPEDPENERQLKLFKNVLAKAKEMGFNPKFVHMANSAAIINMPNALFNLARPGIALYGAYEPVKNLQLELKPALCFHSKIVDIKILPKGCSLSYGHTFCLKRKSKIAIIPVGYDNGYMRALSNKAKILIRGRVCKIVGNICMKTLLADVTDIKEVAVGDKVVLIGKQGESKITVCELAKLANTISYEFLCLIGKLNKRIFIS